MLQKHQLSFTRQPTVSLEVATPVQQDAPLVLVVDDERAMRMLLQMAIAKEGDRVCCTHLRSLWAATTAY